MGVYRSAEVETNHGLPVAHATCWWNLFYTWRLSNGTRGFTFSRDEAAKIVFDYGEKYGQALSSLAQCNLTLR